MGLQWLHLQELRDFSGLIHHTRASHCSCALVFVTQVLGKVKSGSVGRESWSSKPTTSPTRGGYGAEQSLAGEGLKQRLAGYPSFSRGRKVWCDEEEARELLLDQGGMVLSSGLLGKILARLSGIQVSRPRQGKSTSFPTKTSATSHDLLVEVDLSNLDLVVLHQPPWRGVWGGSL